MVNLRYSVNDIEKGIWKGCLFDLLYDLEADPDVLRVDVWYDDDSFCRHVCSIDWIRNLVTIYSFASGIHRSAIENFVSFCTWDSVRSPFLNTEFVEVKNG